MVYFKSTINALQSQIDDLKKRLDDSEAERKSLHDRLLMKHNFSTIAEPTVPIVTKPALQYIAPPGVNPIEIQDAMRDVWIQEESDYLRNELGYDEIRARNQAEQSYNQQHGITH